MDQNSSNNSTGKSNWREKLGIGTNAKEIPKISDEFKPAGPAANSSRPQRIEPKIVARPAPRAPHPIAKPAPMAPRPAQAAPQPAPEANQRPAMRPPRPAQAQPMPVPEPKAESLAERLKSQRQAAERLAEQRISAVRDSVRDTKPEPALGKPGDAARSKALASPSADTPKFTFAQEELASAKADAGSEGTRKYVPAFQANTPPSPAVPPLVPPRPALGGEKSVLPPARQEPAAHPGTQPSAYRPLDPPAYQPQRPPPAVPSQRSGYGDPAGADQRQNLTPRREAFETTRRPPPARLGGEAEDAALPVEEAQRGRRPLPQRPKRPASYDDDLGEVFEDEEAAPPPRRRAKAQDYSQAYREYEDTYEEDERRSAGPWLLLLALLALAVLAFGGIWYYSKYMTPQGVQQTGQSVPVVPAPTQPDKAAQPEAAAAAVNAEPEQAAPAVKKKLIYDRILGDQAIEGGKLVPTEEAPAQMQPAPDTNQQPVPAAEPPENQGLSGQAPPQPMAPADAPSAEPGTNGGAGQPEPLPLPVPPTPGSGQTQGALPPAGGEQTATAAAGPQVSPASVNSTEPDPNLETPAATASTNDASQQTDAQPPQQDPSLPQVEDPAPPAKLKARTVEAPVKAKKKIRVQAQRRQSSEPTVLVPPSAAPADQPAAEQAQTDLSSGSFFGSGKGSTRSAGKQDDKVLSAVRTNFSSKQPDPNGLADTQVASLDQAEPPQAAKPDVRPSTSSGGGYVAQLASFRSEAEAMSEFDRLKAKHRGILGGMSPRVNKGTVGGTTRYRLGVGPMASRDEASKLCNSLIASGERDCIVKQR